MNYNNKPFTWRFILCIYQLPKSRLVVLLLILSNSNIWIHFVKHFLLHLNFSQKQYFCIGFYSWIMILMVVLYYLIRDNESCTKRSSWMNSQLFSRIFSPASDGKRTKKKKPFNAPKARQRLLLYEKLVHIFDFDIQRFECICSLNLLMAKF